MQMKDFQEGDGLKRNMKDFFKLFISMEEIGQRSRTLSKQGLQLKLDLMLKSTFRNLIKITLITSKKMVRMEGLNKGHTNMKVKILLRIHLIICLKELIIKTRKTRLNRVMARVKFEEGND